MADIKEYKIVINGVQESIDAIESLKNKLKDLEERIDAISAKSNINVNITGTLPTVDTTTTTTSNGGGRRDNSGLEEQDALEKQILATEEKLAQVRDENYQKLIHMKNELKEYTQIAKSSAAAEENKQGLFNTNTMLGMKEQLKSIKAEMQTLDVSSDRFRELTQQANALNGKLKEIEQSYGQFGRNVGNYANGVADGLQQVVIKVGDTERTFESAKQAARELGNELKNMAVNGQQGTEEYKNLDEAVKQLNSTIKDVSVSSKSMDTLLDTMQGIIAVASASEGIASLFDIDETAIEQTIQKLVALQNVLQGIEAIRQQMKTNEGIGLILSKGNAAIDNMVKSIISIGTASKAATVATKALSVALKGLGIGLAIAAITTLVNIVDKYMEKVKKAKEEAKKAAEIQEEGAKAYYKSSIEIQNYITRLNSFNGSKEQEKKIVNELNSKYGTAIGNYKTIKQWKDKLISTGKAYCEVLKEEAIQSALAAQLADKMLERRKIQATSLDEFRRIYDTEGGDSAARKRKTREIIAVDDEIKAIETEMGKGAKKIQELQEKYNIGDYSDGIKRGAKKTSKATIDVEKEIARARIDAMKEGLNKTITQLEEERKERLAKIIENGRDYKEAEAVINALYDKKIEDEIQKHTKEVEKMYDDMYKNIRQMEIDNASKEVEIAKNSTKTLENVSKETDDNNADTLIEKTSYGVNSIFSIENEEILKSNKDLVDLINQRELLISDFNKSVTEMSTKRAEAEEKIKTLDDEIRDYEKKNLEYNRKITEAKDELESLEVSNTEKNKQEMLKNEIAYLEDLKSINEASIASNRNKIEELTKQNEKEKIIDKNTLDDKKKTINETVIAINNYQDKIKELYGEDKGNELFAKLNQGAALDDTSLFKRRISNLEAYWAERKKFTIIGAKGERDAELKLLKQTYSAETKAADDNWIQQLQGLSDWQEKERDLILAQAKQKAWTEEKTNRELEELDAKYNKEAKKLNENYNKELDNLAILNGQREVEINEKYKEEQKKVNSEYYQSVLQEYRDFMTALNNKESKAEVSGFLGIINISKTRQNYNEILNEYKTLAQDLKNRQEELKNAFKKGLIDRKQLDSALREIDNKLNTVFNKIEEIKKKSGDSIGKLISDINQYFQAVGQGLQQVLSQIWENQNVAFEKAMEALEKEIDEYEDLLDKQREITEQHKDEMTSIEDELSTARGDRRQQLIDQLNAEMAAQRASLAQEKKIEKEKEKLLAKKEREEEKQKKKEHKRAVTQAIISAALATANGYATAPFIPTGLAMGTLAAALGAIQVALIRSQKFADGGIIQGKSHSQGGVKILGGRAEVEGGEFITNKVTTSKNVELLEYINGKKKRINLDDLVEFYGGNSKVRKNIANVKTKFAQGGQVPTLRSDIGMNDNLTAAFQDYANRPTVVQVVDIVNKTDRLNRVKVMSGLAE